MRIVRSVGFALVCALGMSFGVPNANATVYCDTSLGGCTASTSPSAASGQTIVVDPSDFSNFAYSDQANTSPGQPTTTAVSTFINTYFGAGSTTAGDGSILFTKEAGGSGAGPGNDQGKTSFLELVFGTTAYEFIAIHYDNQYLVLLYDDAVNYFKIMGLNAGVSGVLGFNASVVPLPPAAILFGTALIGMTVLRRRRARNLNQMAS